MTAPSPGQAGDAAAIAVYATLYRLSDEKAAKRWAGAVQNVRDHFREVAQAAIAAAAPAAPLADPGDLAEQWFDGTFDDCDPTARAAMLDAYRAGWAARAAAAPAGTTGEAGCGKCSHPQADHAFRGEPDVCAWRECKCPSYRDPQPQAAPELAAAMAKLRETAADNIRLRELLGEIGVMAANAPEDGDSFALLEDIAMRIAAMDVEDQP